MHPFVVAELARQRQEELLAAAARSRTARASRRARRQRPGGARWGLIARLRQGRHPPPPPTPPATPLTRPARADHDALAWKLAQDGPAGIESQLETFARYAQQCGASPRLLSILVDTSLPDIVRQRAFGRIRIELDNTRPLTATQPRPCDAA